jgi:L-ascorbate metabolism protein UlaG (beta-lactamase superfamily)
MSIVNRSFGSVPSGKTLQAILKSPNYKNGVFQNLTATPVIAEGASYTSMMRNFFGKGIDREPAKPLPHVKTDLKSFNPGEPSIIWFGHSSYLIVADGKKILVDPVFGKRASPVSFAGVEAFKGTMIYEPEDLPELDAVIITHDHYDHLDYYTIIRLQDKVKVFYTSLGVSAHLTYWGVPSDIIFEFDWWDKGTLWPGAELTCTPARHFSGRLFTRGKTLWSSFVLQLNDIRIFIGGDSGYDASFKKIGDTFGPFSIALLECGQYNIQWPYIHMMPEQTVHASQDLQAEVLMPVHWAKFRLALHPWYEPIERAAAEAARLGVTLTTPQIGEPISLKNIPSGQTWWKNR